MERFAIHGHFYQPPRENPWLEAVELQDSAYPYHDWNERITRSATRPTPLSRILDAEGRIARIVNNYATDQLQLRPDAAVLAEGEVARDATERILDADQREPGALLRPRLGPGAGLQPHDHAAGQPPRQAHAGRLGHPRFRAPLRPRAGRHVAAGNRRGHARRWRSWPSRAFNSRSSPRTRPAACGRSADAAGRTSAAGASIPRAPICADCLRAGRINLFFYDGPISRAVAFEQLLNSGEHFADAAAGRLLDDRRSWPQLVHIATDGETYGHHHRHGDMALAYALRLHRVRTSWRASPTTASSWRSIRPRTKCRSIENTSWSCAHGVERWRSDCGCNSGGTRLEPGTGAGRCARRSTGCATQLAPLFEAQGRSAAAAIPGRPATTTST